MSDVLPWASMALTTLFGLFTALGRETIGELKRRIAVLETANATQAAEMAKLMERSTGTADSLKKIELQMVPRAEWEARHKGTDEMLQRILDILADRGSRPDQTPPRPGRYLVFR